jgi:hypothetical protein
MSLSSPQVWVDARSDGTRAGPDRMRHRGRAFRDGRIGATQRDADGAAQACPAGRRDTPVGFRALKGAGLGVRHTAQILDSPPPRHRLLTTRRPATRIGSKEAGKDAMSSSTTLKDRLSHVSDTTPVSGLSDAARHAAGKAGTVAHRAASIAGDTAGTAASATRDAGVSVAHRISDVSGAASRGGAAAREAAGKAAGKASGSAVVASGRAGRRVEKARSRAELSAERARAAAELRAERHRSRRAISAESKARAEADKAQEALEKRLAKAEVKLARVHRHRRRGALALFLLGAGAAGTIAARRYLAQQDESTPITATPAPIGDTGTASSTTSSSTTGSSSAGGASGADGFDERLRTSTGDFDELPGVDTTLGEPTRPR